MSDIAYLLNIDYAKTYRVFDKNMEPKGIININLEEENERLAIVHQELMRLESQRKKQEYIEMKERKHQEYLEMKERKHQEYLEMKEKKHLEWLAEKERRANTFEDKTLTCKKCGKEWVWSASEQKFFKEKGFFRPSMCKECRSSIKTINNFHK